MLFTIKQTNKQTDGDRNSTCRHRRWRLPTVTRKIYCWCSLKKENNIVPTGLHGNVLML